MHSHLDDEKSSRMHDVNITRMREPLSPLRFKDLHPARASETLSSARPSFVKPRWWLGSRQRGQSLRPEKGSFFMDGPPGRLLDG